MSIFFNTHRNLSSSDERFYSNSKQKNFRPLSQIPKFHVVNSDQDIMNSIVDLRRGIRSNVVDKFHGRSKFLSEQQTQSEMDKKHIKTLQHEVGLQNRDSPLKLSVARHTSPKTTASHIDLLRKNISDISLKRNNNSIGTQAANQFYGIDHQSLSPKKINHLQKSIEHIGSRSARIKTSGYSIIDQNNSTHDLSSRISSKTTKDFRLLIKNTDKIELNKPKKLVIEDLSIWNDNKSFSSHYNLKYEQKINKIFTDFGNYETPRAKNNYSTISSPQSVSYSFFSSKPLNERSTIDKIREMRQHIEFTKQKELNNLPRSYVEELTKLAQVITKALKTTSYYDRI